MAFSLEDDDIDIFINSGPLDEEGRAEIHEAIERSRRENPMRLSFEDLMKKLKERDEKKKVKG